MSSGSQKHGAVPNLGASDQQIKASVKIFIRLHIDWHMAEIYRNVICQLQRWQPLLNAETAKGHMSCVLSVDPVSTLDPTYCLDST